MISRVKCNTHAAVVFAATSAFIYPTSASTSWNSRTNLSYDPTESQAKLLTPECKWCCSLWLSLWDFSLDVHDLLGVDVEIVQTFFFLAFTNRHPARCFNVCILRNAVSLHSTLRFKIGQVELCVGVGRKVDDSLARIEFVRVGIEFQLEGSWSGGRCLLLFASKGDRVGFGDGESGGKGGEEVRVTKGR